MNTKKNVRASLTKKRDITCFICFNYILLKVTFIIKYNYTNVLRFNNVLLLNVYLKK